MSEFGDPSMDVRALLQTPEDSENKQVDNPFAFTPIQLSKRLYDPKELDLVRAMGGVEGLTLGLRTDVNKGLSPHEDLLDGHVTLEEVWRILDDPQRRELGRDLAIIRDGPPGLSAEISVGESGLPAVSQGSKSNFQDRRRVFGENKIPMRPPKNILQLMWLALHDKILV